MYILCHYYVFATLARDLLSPFQYEAVGYTVALKFNVGRTVLVTVSVPQKKINPWVVEFCVGVYLILSGRGGSIHHIGMKSCGLSTNYFLNP